MALFDFKKYVINVRNQYMEMKANLADFDQALKDGHITEEQLADVKNDVALIEQNYQRLVYIAYLLEIPRKPKKREKFYKVNKKLVDSFEALSASEAKVLDENTSVLDHIRAKLKALKEKTNN